MKQCIDPQDAAAKLAAKWLEVRGYVVDAPNVNAPSTTPSLTAASTMTQIVAAIQVTRFPDRAAPLTALELRRLGEQAHALDRELLELRVQVDYFGHASAPIQCVRHARVSQPVSSALHAA